MPLHAVSLAAHDIPHTPLVHTCVVVQAVPHAPQCVLLVLVLTQAPEQNVSPFGQGAWQVPVLQI